MQNIAFWHAHAEIDHLSAYSQMAIQSNSPR